MNRHPDLFTAVLLLSGLGASAVMSARYRGKLDRLELSPDKITCAGKVLQRSSLTWELRIWNDAHLHTVSGSALVLSDAQGALCVGGRDYLIANGASGSVVTRVDASLAKTNFAELLEELRVNDAVNVVHERGLVMELIPSPSSVRWMWHSMAPWFLTLAAVCVVGVAAGLLHAERSQFALYAIGGGAVVVLLGGQFATFRGASRRPVARYRLVIEGHQVTLEDMRAGTNSGPLLEATRHFYRAPARGRSVEVPTLCLTWESGKRTVVGVWNTSIRWAGRVPRRRKLDYIVGPEEWRRLTSALKLV